MAKHFWIYFFATLLLCGIAVLWTAANSGAQPLRSEHAQPAIASMSEIVSVSPDGNLFHAATCKDLHKPAETMPASEAIARGYAPCTRCMRKALETQ